MGQESCSTETVDDPDSGGEGKSKSPKARIGQTVTLKGTDTKMRVTPLSVKPVSGGELDTPASGKRYVGVKLRLRNVGETTYDDAPSNGAKLLTRSGEQADPTIVTGGPCAGSFDSDTTISAGGSRQGCLPFEVPKGAKLVGFQFGLDSGFGPQTGEWRVKR